MANIRPKDLPDNATPNPDSKVPSDDGVNVTGPTWVEGVNAARPFASQAQAEAGTDTATGMNPLTTKQAIHALGDARFASAAQGALADSAVQPAQLEAVQVPEGGTSGQVLTKQSSTDNDALWQDPAGVADGDKGDVIVSDAGSTWTSKVVFATIAAAEALVPAVAPDFIRTTGYAVAGDGGGALYKKVASEPSHAGKFSITLSDGVTVVWYELAEQLLNVKMLGAVGDGSTDDTTALQAAIDLLESLGGGTLLVPAGTYKISATLTLNKGIHLVGEGIADDTALAAGTGLRLTTLIWDAAATGTRMIDAVSLTPDAYLYGGAIKGIMLNGNNVATVGFRGQSISGWEIDVAVRQVVTAGVWITDGNGVLSKFNTISVDFTYGSTAAVEGACGLIIDGTASNVGVTQNRILSVSGLYKNGDMLRITDADNNIVDRLHASRASGGTGYGLRLSNGTTNHARNNLIRYMVGHVTAASSTFGNVIEHLISESSSVTISAGGQLHYQTVDYVNAERWKTHTFRMSDELHLPIGTFLPDGTNAVAGVHAAAWGAIIFPNAATGVARTNVGAPYHWNDGTITGVKVWFATDTANTTDNAMLQVDASSHAVGAATATPEKTQTFVTAVNDSANRINTATLTFTTPLNFTKGDTILLAISRLGANASDTMAGDFELLAASLIYKGEGPDSSGSGPFDVPPDGV